jgi:2,3-bisphosphoglycerate-dependent phosphoglycerate mutase
MRNQTIGTLVLIRHGATFFNLEKRFTGWTDVEMAPKGKEEAHTAAKKLKNYKFNTAYTSVLKRAINTLYIILKDLNQNDTPIKKDKALNERHYGDLQGKYHKDMVKEVGADRVQLWRRSFDIAPPNGESLKDTCNRTIPFFEKNIMKDIKEGKTILVSAHGNSLRAIEMKLDNLTPEQVVKHEIGTGIPHIYKIDSNGTVISKVILK